jgi:hypothetical protein
MSNVINDELMERAKDQLDYWTGTMWERLLQQDIAGNDLEALRAHVAWAEAEMAIQEDNPPVEPENDSEEDGGHEWESGVIEGSDGQVLDSDICKRCGQDWLLVKGDCI